MPRARSVRRGWWQLMHSVKGLEYNLTPRSAEPLIHVPRGSASVSCCGDRRVVDRPLMRLELGLCADKCIPGSEVELVADEAHLEWVVLGCLLNARVSLDLATADFKAMFVSDAVMGSRGEAVSIILRLVRLTWRGGPAPARGCAQQRSLEAGPA